LEFEESDASKFPAWYNRAGSLVKFTLEELVGKVKTIRNK
jgi:hypothetical protein